VIDLAAVHQEGKKELSAVRQIGRKIYRHARVKVDVLLNGVSSVAEELCFWGCLPEQRMKT